MLLNNSCSKFEEYYYCPCCHYPTLKNRGDFEICALCSWEDDGQNEFNADEIFGGPNGNYSLTEASDNFKKYYTMYRPSDELNFEMDTLKKSMRGGLDKIQLKKEIISNFEKLYNVKSENLIFGMI